VRFETEEMLSNRESDDEDGGTDDAVARPLIDRYEQEFIEAKQERMHTIRIIKIVK